MKKNMRNNLNIIVTEVTKDLIKQEMKDQKQLKTIEDPVIEKNENMKMIKIPKLFRSTHRYCQYCFNTMPSYKDFERCNYCDRISDKYVISNCIHPSLYKPFK